MLRIEVVYALPQRYWRAVLRLRTDATVSDAIAAARAAGTLPSEAFATTAFAVYGRSVKPQAPLRDGDRVELLRPLHADPMEARRRRADKTTAGKHRTKR